MKLRRPLACLLCCILLISSATSASAGTTAAELRKTVSKHLNHEGYLGRFANGQDFERAVSAYLWDHRTELTTTDFHRSRQVGVLICLLINKGYPGFEALASQSDFMRQCQNITK